MSDYLMKEWLTFEEAASWLSDQTGKQVRSSVILNAARSHRLPVHYWPTDRKPIGLFAIETLPGVSPWKGSGFKPMPESPLMLDIEQCLLLCDVDGPVPVRHFEIFYENRVRGFSRPIGLSVLDHEPDIYGCYRLGPSGELACITAGEYDFVVHLGDLEQMHQGLPLPKPRPPHDIQIYAETLVGTDETVERALSTVGWLTCPLSEAESVVAPPRLQRGTNLLRALGFATHLIAELGEKLDMQAEIASDAKGYCRNKKPNAAAIARELARVAKMLKHDGHGVKGDGFEKLLRAGLDEVR